MLSLTRTRAWVAGTVVLCLLLTVASYFLLISPKRAEAAALDQQTVDVQASNAVLQARVAELRAQFAELPQREAELAAVKEAMPEVAALPTLVRGVDDLALASDVTLTSLTPGVGIVVPPAASTIVAAPPAEGQVAPDPAADPAAAGAVGASSDLLVAIPTSVVVVGTFSQAELFLKKLQTELPRAFLVTDFTVTAESAAAEAAGGRPAVAIGDVTMTVSGSVFVLRSAAAALVGAPGTVSPGTVSPDGVTTTITP